MAHARRYVSFVEILSTKAVQGFQDAGFNVAQSQRYACFSFFAGLMATWMLSKSLELISTAAKAWQKHKVRACVNLSRWQEQHAWQACVWR